MGKLDLIEKGADHSVNVIVTTAEIVPVNKMRSSLLIVNDSDEVIYLAKGRDAVLNQGIRLNAAGGAYEITTINMFCGYLTAIHGGTGNKRLTIDEVEGYAA